MATKKKSHDIAEKVIPIEPVFTLRARDPFAACLVRNWITLARSAGVNGPKIFVAEQIVWQMERWPEKKIPD